MESYLRIDIEWKQIIIEFIINMIGVWLFARATSFKTKNALLSVRMCDQRSNETELYMTFEDRL